MASVAALVVVAATVGALVGGFPDLHVYRYAGRSVLDQWPAYRYDDPVTGYPLTYPPFAALLMVPVALLPNWAAAGLWTGLSAGCLAAAAVLTRRASGRPVLWTWVLAASLAALALEPVWQNYAFGQVNAILMLLVLVDVLRPERRWSGVLVGIAAGVKLTPLVFVVLLVVVGQRAAAGRAVAAFAATVVVGLVAFPGAASYWTDGLLDPGRVGPPALAHNQSVSGAMTRVLDPPSTDGPVGGGRRPARSGRPDGGEGVVAPRRPRARGLPRRAGDAARLAGVVVAPLGLGPAHGAGAVAAQPGRGTALGGGVRRPADAVAAVGGGQGARLALVGAPPGQRLPPRRARGRDVAGRHGAVGSSFIAWSAIFFIM